MCRSSSIQNPNNGYSMKTQNKICVVTGASTGIGKATAVALAKMDYTIIMLVRDSGKSRTALEEIKAVSKSYKIIMFHVDLSSQMSIRKVSQEISTQFSSIDVLINNAGVLKKHPLLSIDGIEMTYAVNVIAPFLLTNLLLPLLEKSNAGRIINLTSELYKKGKIEFEKVSSLDNFDGNKAYANSKLMVVVNTLTLANKLKGTNVTVNCVHPGVVGTEVFRDYPIWFRKFLNLFISKPAVGAQPSVFLASSPELTKTTGKYYYKTIQSPLIEAAYNEDTANQIWEFCEQITG